MGHEFYELLITIFDSHLTSLILFFLIVVGYILTFIEEIIANDENYLF